MDNGDLPRGVPEHIDLHIRPPIELLKDERRLLYDDRSVVVGGVPSLTGSLNCVLEKMSKYDEHRGEAFAWMVLDTLQRLERAGGRMGYLDDSGVMMMVVGQVILWRGGEAKIRSAEVQRILSLGGFMRHARLSEWVGECFDR